ncbi:MAG: lipopolysaccharide assembly protein LapB [Lautropia sp.]
MEFEYWWLLAIPLFFGLGWLAARSDGRLATRAPDNLPSAYFKGLNFLLNEQPDKAIDAFVEVVRIEPEAVELHFALGALFRRRGETDRAIRVHQNLVDRDDLDTRERSHALFELGQDFMKAGLIDRAEDAFNRLQGGEYAAAASRQRLEIAQMTHDWQRVIDLARDTPSEPGFDTRRVIAQAYCELATASLAANDLDGAMAHAREAQAAVPDHPRPLIVAGQIAARQDDMAAARRSFEQLADRSPEYVALIADRWLAAAEASDGAGGLRAAIARIQRLDVAARSPDILRAVADAIAKLDGKPAAAQWVRQCQAARPSLLGLQILLELSRSPPSGHGSAAELDEAALQNLVDRQAERLTRYACSVCGFRARTYYWQCPGCHRWDSYAPIRSED